MVAVASHGREPPRPSRVALLYAIDFGLANEFSHAERFKNVESLRAPRSDQLVLTRLILLRGKQEQDAQGLSVMFRLNGVGKDDFPEIFGLRVCSFA